MPRGLPLSDKAKIEIKWCFGAGQKQVQIEIWKKEIFDMVLYTQAIPIWNKKGN